MTVIASDLTPFQRSTLDFKIATAEQQRYKSFLCVNGEFLTLEEVKRLRDEYDLAQAGNPPTCPDTISQS